MSTYKKAKIGKGWFGNTTGHSNAARGYESAKQKEKQHIMSQYHREYPTLSKSEIKKLHACRIAYARKYNEDAVHGVPRRY